MIFTIEMVEKILYPISDRPERGGGGGDNHCRQMLAEGSRGKKYRYTESDMNRNFREK